MNDYFFQKICFSNLGLGDAIIGQKTGLFAQDRHQNSSKRHLKIDRSHVFIFLKIKEKKGGVKAKSP